MKKIVLIGLLALLCVSVTLFGTVALITNEQTAVNVITMGDIEIEAVQSKAPVEFKIVPAAKSGWKVSVKNTGGQDAFIRVKLDKVINLANGVQGVPDPSVMQFDINGNYWELKDGYYYYKTPLEAGKESQPLFTELSFDKDAGNMYQQATASATVNIYAVQVKNNGESATQALGWPEAE